MEKQKTDNPMKSRKIITTEELFGGASELVIRHKADHYRLLITRSGKLILNK